MKTILALTKRNILIYIKDKAAIFFSIMSMLIIIGLMVIFLGKMNVDSILQIVPVEREKAINLVNSWVMAGIVVVNSITITLGIVGVMIEDQEKKKIAAFLVAPISRFKITLSYILAAFAMGCIMCIITFVISEIYIISFGGQILSFNEIIKVLGLIIINVFSSSCFVYFLAIFIRSLKAFSALSTIVGTLVGFIAGIYLPMGEMPATVQKIIKLFPVVYGTSLMREIYVKTPMNDIFGGASIDMVEKYEEYMGITLSWGIQDVLDIYKILILLGSGIIFILLSALILRNKKIADL